ncbi:hypothetical protein [Paracidovorax cattleyae]|uniref:hypothetical protein n=1 Tax=Paracidovorax cattleyae TaxID=80868 RepID=UPI0018AFF9E7|nr:hypothetical protein [Paracidovorax cattleyae]MBF9266055.1 hypothetical protein [Paracidovorax cattleyae]
MAFLFNIDEIAKTTIDTAAFIVCQIKLLLKERNHMNSRKEDQRRNGMPWTCDIYQLKMGLCTALLILGLVGCERLPEPSCRETVQVFERNEQQVLKAANGVYLRKDFNIAACERGAGAKENEPRRFVAGGGDVFYWYEDRLVGMREYGGRVRGGKWPKEYQPKIQIYIGFGGNDSVGENNKNKLWWFENAIPHAMYPIDLLPNFGLKEPGPEAGKGSVKSSPPYWAVRGTHRPGTGWPFTTFCSMRSPDGWDGKDYSPEATKEQDPEWLVRARTFENITVGNTCRGKVSADNGKSIGAMVDVPGAAVKDIDKIYKAVAAYLSEMTVE